MALRGVTFRGIRFEGQGHGVVIQTEVGRCITLTQEEWDQVLASVERDIADSEDPSREPHKLHVSEPEPAVPAAEDGGYQPAADEPEPQHRDDRGRFSREEPEQPEQPEQPEP